MVIVSEGGVLPQIFLKDIVPGRSSAIGQSDGAPRVQKFVLTTLVLQLFVGTKSIEDWVEDHHAMVHGPVLHGSSA